MNPNTTKILIAIVLGLVLLLSIFGIYRYFSSNQAEEGTTATDTTNVFPTSGNVKPQIEETQTTDNRITANTSTNRTSSTTIASIQNGEANIKIISERPTTGSHFIDNKKLYVRYMERESGHIYDLGFNENLSKKVTNTTITKIYEAFFNNTQKNVLIRGFDDNDTIRSIYATIENTTSTTSVETNVDSAGKLSQVLLPNNIVEVAVSPSNNKIFYLTEVLGSYIGTTEDFGPKIGLNKKQIFSSALSDWQVQWPEENNIFFNTKPSAFVPGYLYQQTLNKTSGLTKVLNNIKGLTSRVSPDIKKLVYSESTSGGIKMYLYNLTTRENSQSPLTTLPEKCIWGGIEKDVLYCSVPSSIPFGDYPDNWYQGVISFNDELWKFNTKTGNTELLIDKATLGRNGGIDAINLSLSPQEDYILLTNKKDNSLWQIKIK